MQNIQVQPVPAAHADAEARSLIVFLNGKLVPAAQAVVSVNDRGFLYGDGVFETIRVTHGTPFRWVQHWERLQRGADFLKIRLPANATDLRAFAAELIHRNQMPEAVLRLTVSRGVGPRGYSPKSADHPTVLMTLHAVSPLDLKAPPRWHLITSSHRVTASDPLLPFKTCNKLRQVLARAEADAAGADEALLLNTEGHLAEASAANLFWISDNVVCTPALSCGLLPGITRQVVRELCEKRGWAWREVVATPEVLAAAQGIFVTFSTWGLLAVATLDKRAVGQSPLTGELLQAYWQLVHREVGVDKVK
jgi:aminodeoxychorismate lyase